MNQSNRKSIDDTWKALQESGWSMPQDEDGTPFIPSSIPNYDDDDDDLGFSFFRELVELADLSNVSLPKTYFGRSELSKCSFRNTDLTQSRMCWNDFIECDFSDADLSSCDMRGSLFQGCDFSNANLTKADLRHSSFENCNFSNASVDQAIVSLAQSANFSKAQTSKMKCVANEGELPPGG